MLYKSSDVRFAITCLTIICFLLLDCMASFQSGGFGKTLQSSRTSNLRPQSIRGSIPSFEKSHLSFYLVSRSKKCSRTGLPMMMVTKNRFFSFRKKSRKNGRKKKKADVLLIPEYQLPSMKKTDFRRSFLESYRQSSAILKGIKNNEIQPGNNSVFKQPDLRVQTKELGKISEGFNGDYWTSDVRKKDRSILSFLPSSILNGTMPPKTEDLLIHLTWEYMNVETKTRKANTEPNNEDQSSNTVDMEQILNIIDEEYKFNDVPYTVGDVSYLSGIDEDETERNARIKISKIISFAALYRLPSEIVVALLDKDSLSTNSSHKFKGNSEIFRNNETIMMTKLIEDFKREGWMSVAFPKGLSIRVCRSFLQSNNKRFSLSRLVTPIQSLSFRYTGVRKHASVAIREAFAVKPPKKIKDKNVDVLHKLDESLRVLIKSDYSSYWKALLQKPFFPKKKFQRFSMRWRSFTRSLGKEPLRNFFLGIVTLIFSSAYIMYKRMVLRNPVSSSLGLS